MRCAPPLPDRPPENTAAYRYVARQPILDIQGRVRAYELLFRDGINSIFAGDGEQATRIMIDNSVMFGPQELTNGLPAFLNCTAETLMEEHIRLLPAETTVLEVLENVEPTAEVVNVCHRLKADGYRLALDDFLYRPALDPLVEIADYIKIDYLNTDDERRASDLARLGRFNGALIAEKVEDQAVYKQACEEGCSLFQGYYFFRPLLIKRQKVPGNQYVHLRLLALLQQSPLDLFRIDEAVKSEPSLAYRLLRYVNSPVYGLQERVTSIRAALIAVGDDQFRRMAVLAVTSELNRGPTGEIVRMALIRARFCETAAAFCGLNPTELYLVGLFSLLPAMVQRPMDEVIAELPLRAAIREALLGISTPLRGPLAWLESRERGDFERSDALAREHNFDSLRLNGRFAEATLWADRLLAF